jgi:hypothetical protein
MKMNLYNLFGARIYMDRAGSVAYAHPMLCGRGN